MAIKMLLQEVELSKSNGNKLLLNAAIDKSMDEALEIMEQKKTEANNSINSTKTTSVNDVNNAKTNALNDIDTAKSGALSSINSTKTTSINAVKSTKDSAISVINTNKDSALTDIGNKETSVLNTIDSAESSSTSAINAAGSAVVSDIEDKKTEVMNIINGAIPSIKGINYSTDEQDTGLTWIDGKKIYQKTFSLTQEDLQSFEYVNRVIGRRSEIEEIIDFKMIGHTDSGNPSYHEIPYYETQNNYVAGGSIGVAVLNGILIYTITNMSFEGTNYLYRVYATVKYTKVSN